MKPVTTNTPEMVLQPLCNQIKDRDIIYKNQCQAISSHERLQS